MGWVKGKRRNGTLGGNWLRLIPTKLLQKWTGKSERAVRRWQSGKHFPKDEIVEKIIKNIIPMSTAALPIVGDYPLCGNTRVLGVGEYSIRSAKGVFL